MEIQGEVHRSLNHMKNGALLDAICSEFNLPLPRENFVENEYRYQTARTNCNNFAFVNPLVITAVVC